MFIPESAYGSTELPSPPTATRKTTTVFVADITCILCSREIGTAVAPNWPPVISVLVQLEGSAVLRRIALDRLRCPDCGPMLGSVGASITSIERSTDTGDRRCLCVADARHVCRRRFFRRAITYSGMKTLSCHHRQGRVLPASPECGRTRRAASDRALPHQRHRARPRTSAASACARTVADSS